MTHTVAHPLAHSSGGVIPVYDCPYCGIALGWIAALEHLSKHGVVGIREDQMMIDPQGLAPIRYRCACGFEGRTREMEDHWYHGDRKHAALCTLGDLGGAVPFHRQNQAAGASAAIKPLWGVPRIGSPQ